MAAAAGECHTALAPHASQPVVSMYGTVCMYAMSLLLLPLLLLLLLCTDQYLQLSVSILVHPFVVHSVPLACFHLLRCTSEHRHATHTQHRADDHTQLVPAEDITKPQMISCCSQVSHCTLHVNNPT